MTLRLIPNVYQMLFAKKYAQKQVTALYKKKSDQLRESAIGLEELFSTQLGAVSKGFIKIGEQQQKANDMFGIKPAKLIVYYYKNIGSGAEDNSAKVLFLNSYAELFMLIKSENFQNVKDFSYLRYEGDNKIKTPKEMSIIHSKASNKPNNPEYSAEHLLNQWDLKTGPMWKDKNKRKRTVQKIERLDELTEYKRQNRKKIDHPLIKGLKAFYFRLTRGDEFLDIYDSIENKEIAVPKETIIIRNVNKETKLTPELYDKEFQEKAGIAESEKLELRYLMTFITAFNKILATLDIDLKDTSLIYDKRKEIKRVSVKSKSTAAFFKKEENKIKVVEDLKSRTRKLIYSQWEKKKIKNKDVTQLSVGQTVIKRLRNYKAVFKKSDNAFSIFNSVLLELEQGAVLKLNPITNIVEVNPEKEITLGKELSLFAEKEEIDILKGAKEKVIIEKKEVEQNKNPLFGNIEREEEIVRYKKKMNSIIDKIKNAWDKDKATSDLSKSVYEEQMITEIWRKKAFTGTVDEIIALKKILYDVAYYFDLHLFIKESEIWEKK